MMNDASAGNDGGARNDRDNDNGRNDNNDDDSTKFPVVSSNKSSLSPCTRNSHHHQHQPQQQHSGGGANTNTDNDPTTFVAEPCAVEMNRLIRDVYTILGLSSSSSSMENKNNSSTTLLLLQPRNLVTEYHYAVTVCPGLVTRETPVSAYLRTVDYQPRMAADRLARYWKMRKLLFGPDRWLLPMTQTGTGCLDMHHIATLRSGYVTIVPPPSNENENDDTPTTTDNSNKNTKNDGPLWIMDPALLPGHVTQGHQPWIALYLGTACTCRQSQSPGITLLVVIRPGQRPPLTFATPSTSGMLVAPARIHQMLFVQAASPYHQHLLDFMGYQHQRIVEYCLVHKKNHKSNNNKSNSNENNLDDSSNYNATSPQSTLIDLNNNTNTNAKNALGIPASRLPTSLGGSIGMPYFHNWVRMRLSVEDVFSGIPSLVRNGTLARRHLLSQRQCSRSSSSRHYPNSKNSHENDNDNDNLDDNYVFEEENDTTLALAVTYNHSTNLHFHQNSHHNNYYYRDGDDNDPLHFYVDCDLKQHDGETAAAFKKRKHGVYARRSYHRRKVVQALWRAQLEQQTVVHQQLRKEEARLQALWVQAQQIIIGHHATAAIVPTEQSPRIMPQQAMDVPLQNQCSPPCFQFPQQPQLQIQQQMMHSDGNNVFQQQQQQQQPNTLPYQQQMLQLQQQQQQQADFENFEDFFQDIDL